ncbi:MAG: D-aminoacylase [Gemmatimonadota bacterium]|nr:D-aminoacylase [Gemmatimonadota bacterium]
MGFSTKARMRQGGRAAGRQLLVAALLVPLLPRLPPNAPTASAQQFDLLIQNGRLLDGMGNPWYYADVAVTGDRIVAVGRLEGATARRVIDARGLYVAPGFIDPHTHAGTGLVREDLSHAQPLLAQGITFALLNPDGGGPVDLAAQRDQLLAHGLGINVGLLVPHGSVRRAVLGMDDRAPSAAELAQMQQLVRDGMERGAFGMSSGPYYAPGSYSTTRELVELARVVAEYDGAYTSHIRDEADYNIGVVAAVEEVITVAREARLPGVATHLKVLGPRVWGYSMAVVERIERAREAGVEVFADQYPYLASGTSVTGALVPRWAQVGGRDALLARIDSPTERARLRADMIENLDRRGGADKLQFRYHTADPSVEGRTLQAVADERGVEPVDLAIALVQAGGAGVVSFNMHPRDVDLIMRQPWTMTSSDGGLVPMGQGVPHPRYYGAFPRKIRQYVVHQDVIGLEHAVRSMTSLTAAVFRIPDRGTVQPGAIADVVVFDLESLTDRATYNDPHQLCEGMQYVLVNGRLAIDGGAFTDELAGRVVQRR